MLHTSVQLALQTTRLINNTSNFLCSRARIVNAWPIYILLTSLSLPQPTAKLARGAKVSDVSDNAAL
jgi:hypothetical protein